MSQPELLKRVVQVLDETGIPYMLTGSMAMNYYAQPRMTRDIDVVVALQRQDVETVGQQLLFDDQWREQPDDVSVASAGDDDHAGPVAGLDDALGGLGIGLHCPRPDQLQGDLGSPPPLPAFLIMDDPHTVHRFDLLGPKP